MPAEEKFGCEHCWPPEAEAAWKAREKLSCETELVDQSHFGVRIVGCSRCNQRFVSVFTETIDWVDGEDPQYWTLLPLTPAEAEDLTSQEISGIERKLNSLGHGRRSLGRDYPKGSPPRLFWGTGLLVGPHD